MHDIRMTKKRLKFRKRNIAQIEQYFTLNTNNSYKIAKNFFEEEFENEKEKSIKKHS